MIQLDITESIAKTDYYKKLHKWNDRLDVATNNYIEVELTGIEDMFIELYFDLQENLDVTLSEVSTFDKYNMFYIMKVINEYFYSDIDNPPFPFGVAVYLINIGHKDKFLKDIYYLVLLYETREVFDIFYNRQNGNGKLISMEDDVLKIKSNTYKKYRVYLPGDDISRNIEDYNINNIETYQKIISLVKSYSTKHYDINRRGLYTADQIKFKIIMNYVHKILCKENTIIHGEFVNSLIHGKNENLIKDYDSYNIKVSFYNVNFMDKVGEIIRTIYDDNLNVKIKQSKEYIHISFITSKGTFGQRSYIDNFVISKHVYQNINDVLESENIDSQSCGIYGPSDNKKIVYTERYKFATENRLCVVNPNHMIGDNHSNIYNNILAKNTLKGYDLFIPGAIHLIGNYIFPICDKAVNDTLKNLILNVYKENFTPMDVLPLRMIFRSFGVSYGNNTHASTHTSFPMIGQCMCMEAKELGSKFDILKIEKNIINNNRFTNIIDEIIVNNINSDRNNIAAYTYFKDIRHLKDILESTLEGDYKVRYYDNVCYNKRANDYLAPFMCT